MIHKLYQPYYQNQAKWVKGLFLLLICYGLYKLYICVRRGYKRQYKKLKKEKHMRVQMEKGQ